MSSTQKISEVEEQIAEAREALNTILTSINQSLQNHNGVTSEEYKALKALYNAKKDEMDYLKSLRDKYRTDLDNKSN